MLKKLVYSLLIIVFFPCFNVYAASTCSYSEQAALNSEASNIKASYKVTRELIDPSEYTCFKRGGCEEYKEYLTISLLNLSDNFYVEVSNSLNDVKITLDKYDINEETGEVTFNWSRIDKVTTFTLKIFSSNKTNCYGENYRTIRITTPRKNTYANHELCVGHENLDLCQEYVTYEDLSINEFLTKINEKIEKKSSDEEEKNKVSIISQILNFIITYKIYFISAILVITIVIIIIAVRKRQRRIL